MPHTRFLHSGGAGDVIYSLPFVRAQGGGSLYIKPYNEFNQSCDVYEVLKPLLLAQPYITEVHPYDPKRKLFEIDPATPTDVNLDNFRNNIEPGVTVIPKSYFGAFGIPLPDDWARPWLTVDPMLNPGMHASFAVISVTPRYRNPRVDWKRVVQQALRRHGRLFFVGLMEELQLFYRENDHPKIGYLGTSDLLEVARYIACAEAVYCNQNPCLTIAQAMGKKCFVETAPGSSSCVLGLEEVLSSG